ncbi:MAG: ABC transporter permease subunit, partial [Chloroflexi bacterium]|nr:ABC transporter permease subunit [Chloroflexota bacterium]
MRNTLIIAWKETRSYFSSPTAYVVGAMFLVLTGIFFVFDMTRPFAEASVRGFISWATFFIVFLAPLLSMRLLAEEQKMGTLELLLTAPVRDWEVVVGKYLASLATLGATLAFTLFYVLLLFVFGDPDVGPLLSAYLGL